MKRSFRNYSVLIRYALVRPWLKRIVFGGHTLRRKRLRSAVVVAAPKIVALIVFALISYLFFSIANVSGDITTARARIVEGVLSALMNLVFLVIFGSAVGTAIKTMFYSNDLPLLERLPVSERVMFAYKGTETLCYGSYSGVLIALPILIGYALSGASGGSLVGKLMLYLSIPITMTAVVILCISVGILLALLVSRLSSQNSISFMFWLLVLSFLVLWGWLYEREVGSFNLDDQAALQLADSLPGSSTSELAPVSEYLGYVGSLFEPLLTSPLLAVPPGSWAADALSGAASIEPRQFLGGFTPLVILAVICMVLCTEVCASKYASGREKTRAAGDVKTLWIFSPSQAFSKILPLGTRASFVKECCFILREPRSTLNLAGMLIAPIGLLWLIRSSVPEFFTEIENGIVGVPQGSRLEEVSIFFIFTAPYLLTAAAGAGAAVRAGESSVGYEGKAYRIYATSPTTSGKILFGKCAAHALIGGAVAIVTTVVLPLFLWSFWLPGLLVGIIGGIGLSVAWAMIHIGAGAMFARFDWDNPDHATRKFASSASLATVDILLTLLGVVIAIVLFLVSTAFPGLPIWVGMALLGVTYIVLCACVGYLTMRLGARTLDNIEW